MRWTGDNAMTKEYYNQCCDEAVGYAVRAMTDIPQTFLPTYWIIASQRGRDPEGYAVFSFWIFEQDSNTDLTTYALDSGIAVGLQRVPIAAFFCVQQCAQEREFIRVVGATFSQWLFIAEIEFTRDDDTGHLVPGDVSRLYHPNVLEHYAPSDTASGNPAEFLHLDSFLMAYVEAVHKAQYGYSIDINDPKKYVEGRAT